MNRDERIKALSKMSRAQLIAERRVALTRAGIRGENASAWSKDELIAAVLDAEDRLARGRL